MTFSNDFDRRTRGLTLGAAVLALAWGQAVSAQTAPPPASESSTPANLAPPADANDPHRLLSAALVKLGRNPRDSDALLQAGDAALLLGDVQAATGFLSRADRLLPYNPRIMASLASARLRARDPVTAIGLFEDAEKAGAIGAEQIADRGLAYDLVSDNAAAQRYYRAALAAGAGDEAVRRLALSLAIMGNRRAVETALAPLLQKQDKAAWRIRAFAFAIMGREEEAVAIANSTMPPDLASAFAPYLRYMRKLTPAQQAAAANLGYFPQASQIGQDTPRITEWIEGHGLKRMVIAEPPAPVDTPAPKLAKVDTKKDKRKPKVEPVPAPEPAPPEPAPPEPMPSRESSPAAPVELTAAEPERRAVPVPVKAEAARKPVASPAVAGFDLGKGSEPAPMGPTRRDVASEPAPPLAAEPAPAAPIPNPAPPPKKPSFSELFQDFGAANTVVTPAAGAVDIRKITAPRPAPKVPPPPQHPARVWVQIGVGRDADRVAFDWRKMTRAEPELLKGRKASMAEWGRTSRVLVGPFDDEGDAKAFNDKLHKAGYEKAFVWNSPEGQAVDPLDKK